jgi:hypothetical protein
MPGKIKEVTFPDGVNRRIEELDFDIIKEDWNEYQLSDGSFLKLKAVVHKVAWVVNDNDERQYTVEGDPWIFVRSANQVVAFE